MQRDLFKVVTDPNTPAAAKAHCARAWEVLEARKAKLRGVGEPKQVQAVNDPSVKRQRKPSAGPIVSDLPPKV